MAKMKALQVPKAGADFEIVEREIPQPGPRQVRIHVEACGICHSDVVAATVGCSERRVLVIDTAGFQNTTADSPYRFG